MPNKNSSLTVNKIKSKIEINLEVATNNLGKDLPSNHDFKKWIAITLHHPKATQINWDAKITIRLVGRAESEALNSQYRKKMKPTNVLTFCYLPREDILSPYDMIIANKSTGKKNEKNKIEPYKQNHYQQMLADLVICIPIVREEAKTEGITFIEHLAHLTIHGILHALGFSHDKNKAALAMENLEDDILKIIMN